MNLSTTSDMMAALWAAIQKPANHTHADRAARVSGYFHREVVSRNAGWAALYQVDDMLHDLGVVDMLGLRCELTREGILKLFDILVVTRAKRPDVGEEMVFLFDYVASADFAKLLIDLERCGLAVDPRPFVAPLRPAIRRKAMLTKSELRLFWYSRERHRCEPVVIEASIGDGRGSVDLPTGYSASLVPAGAHRPAQMIVTPGPRRRDRVA